MRIRQKVFGIVLLALLPATLAAQNFVYTNNDNSATNGNTITAYAVDANGVISPLSCSPINTGGTGVGGGLFGSNRIITTGDYLYATNAGSNDVSGFTVNQSTGCLTPISSKPFATGGTGSPNGISLAATPDGKYLYAGNSGSQNITVFSIGSGGVLAQVGSLVSVAGGPAGMKVSPDGKYLVVALPLSGSATVNKIAVFSIGSTGGLTPVSGSPFTSSGADASGVDINCQSNELFIGNALMGPAQVDVFNFPPSGGSMTEVSGSPFSGASTPSVQNSSVVKLSPDGSELFVSNQYSNSVTVFSVGTGGTLSLVAGSPFMSGVGQLPAGLATDQKGTFLYSANKTGSTVSSLAISAGGILSGASGSPFPDLSSTGLESLAAYPPATCSNTVTSSSFSVKLDTSTDGFGLNGTFTSGAGGVDPISSPVTLQIGPSYSFTIPAGSFSQLVGGNFAGGYVFSGTIGGASIQVQIDVLQSSTYQIKVAASGVDLTSLASPISVTLTIGNDTATGVANSGTGNQAIQKPKKHG